MKRALLRLVASSVLATGCMPATRHVAARKYFSDGQLDRAMRNYDAALSDIPDTSSVYAEVLAEYLDVKSAWLAQELAAAPASPPERRLARLLQLTRIRNLWGARRPELDTELAASLGAGLPAYVAGEAKDHFSKVTLLEAVVQLAPSHAATGAALRDARRDAASYYTDKARATPASQPALRHARFVLAGRFGGVADAEAAQRYAELGGVAWSVSVSAASCESDERAIAAKLGTSGAIPVTAALALGVCSASRSEDAGTGSYTVTVKEEQTTYVSEKTPAGESCSSKVVEISSKTFIEKTCTPTYTTVSRPVVTMVDVKREVPRSESHLTLGYSLRGQFTIASPAGRATQAFAADETLTDTRWTEPSPKDYKSESVPSTLHDQAIARWVSRLRGEEVAIRAARAKEFQALAATRGTAGDLAGAADAELSACRLVDASGNDPLAACASLPFTEGAEPLGRGGITVASAIPLPREEWESISADSAPSGSKDDMYWRGGTGRMVSQGPEAGLVRRHWPARGIDDLHSIRIAYRGGSLDKDGAAYFLELGTSRISHGESTFGLGVESIFNVKEQLPPWVMRLGMAYRQFGDGDVTTFRFFGFPINYHVPATRYASLDFGIAPNLLGVLTLLDVDEGTLHSTPATGGASLYLGPLYGQARVTQYLGVWIAPEVAFEVGLRFGRK